MTASAIADINGVMSSDVLTDIHAFLARTGMGKSYFGKASCGNSELVDRLERGKTITLVTADKVRRFIEEREARQSSEVDA